MRKIKRKKKIYIPDPKFNDSLVTRFISHLMKNGKKNLAYRIFYNAIDKVESIKEKTEEIALEIWKKSLNNIMPYVEVRSKRIGGTNIQVPVPISGDGRITKAMKLLIDSAYKRKEKTMKNKLAFEIWDAFKEQGESIKRKENIHKMAEANKAFSHFRF